MTKDEKERDIKQFNKDLNNFVNNKKNQIANKIYQDTKYSGI